jgi:cytochrome c-type biogenesis protein CcmH/NrfG
MVESRIQEITAFLEVSEIMSKALSNSQQRISALLRVIALVCILLGGVFAYDIYQTTLIPQLVPIFYFMAALMIFVGAVVLISRFD